MNITALATIVGSLNFFPKMFSSNGTEVSVPSSGETSSVKTPMVTLEVYLESGCTQSTRFFNEQLVKTWMKLGPQHINLTIVPFGKARCRSNADSYFCSCEHGHDECRLNQLENCVIESLGHTDRIVQAVGCIQKQPNLATALDNCVQNNVYLESVQMSDCSLTSKGRKLLYNAGLRTVELNPPLATTPWIIVNGKQNKEAQLNLMKSLCQELDPKPRECQGNM